MKKLAVVVLMVLFMIISVSSAHAGTWFTGTIKKLLVKQDGTIEITLDDSGTDRWGRVDLNGEWKAFLATALTAQAGIQTVRMNYEAGKWIMIELQE